MKILILNWRDIKNPESGGAEIATMEHAKEWVKKGHNITWFTSGFENAQKEESLSGVSIIRRGNFITVYLFAPFFYLFSKNKFDLVIDEIHGIPFFTPIYVRKPKIAYIHEVAKELWDYMYPFPVNIIGKIMERLIFVFYRNIKFMTVSNSTKQALVNLGIKSNNITVILNGNNDKPVNALPNKEKIFTFVFVSRVVKMKGIEEVIKAFFFILRHIKNGQLWIVGDGDKKYLDYLKHTMNIYSISTKVKFFGHTTDSKRISLIRRAHLLLHASIKEGWGLVIVEAASQATPSVVYNVAGLKDSVQNGKTGIVIKKNSPKEMANEAVGLLNDKDRYKKLQENAVKFSKSLTWDRSTTQSLKLIQSVAANG